MYQNLAEAAVGALWGTFFKYGLPAMLICLALSYIGARLKERKKRKRPKSNNRRAWRKD